jgi:hypothetical protein
VANTQPIGLVTQAKSLQSTVSRMPFAAALPGSTPEPRPPGAGPPTPILVASIDAGPQARLSWTVLVTSLDLVALADSAIISARAADETIPRPATTLEEAGDVALYSIRLSKGHQAAADGMRRRAPGRRLAGRRDASLLCDGVAL